MNSADLSLFSFFAAFLAGLVSFLSPCVLPLVPSYISTFALVGRPIKGAIYFVVGFGLIFIAFGASASIIGTFLVKNREILEKIGGVLIVFFGLILLNLIPLSFFKREFRFNLTNSSRYGMLILGAAFAFGWTPCIGPILGSILSLAASQNNIIKGIILLFTYTLGLAVPFLLVAIGWDRLSNLFKKLNKISLIIEKISGVLLIITGILLLTGEFTRLNTFFLQNTPDWLRKLL